MEFVSNNGNIHNQISNVEVPILFLNNLISCKFTKSVCKVTLTLLQLLANKNPYIDTTQRYLAKLSGVQESKITQILERMESMKLCEVLYVQRGIRIKMLGAQKHFLKQYRELNLDDYDDGTIEKYKNSYLKLPMIIFSPEFHKKSELFQRVCIFMIIESFYMSNKNKTNKYSLDSLAKKFSATYGKDYTNRSRLQDALNNVEEFLKMEFKTNIKREYKNGIMKRKIIYELRVHQFAAGSCSTSRIDVQEIDLRGNKIFEYIKYKLEKYCDYNTTDEERKSWITLYMHLGDYHFTDVLIAIGMAHNVNKMPAYVRGTAKLMGYIEDKKVS